MKKYIQQLIVNINEKFDVLPHFYFKNGVAKEQSITKDLLPFVKNNKLYIQEAVVEKVWNSFNSNINYFLGGTCINNFITDKNLEILISDKIKVEIYN